MKSLISVVALATLCSGLVRAAEHALDGRAFDVQYGERGKAALAKDTLTFRDGRFHSSACDDYGFGTAVYVTTSDAKKFTVETSSKTEGRIRWQGSLTKDGVEGLFVWTKPGQAPIEYWWKGSVER
jgi:hypothetical protein